MVNTATILYINWQGCLWSRRMSQLARHLQVAARHPHPGHPHPQSCSRCAVTTAHVPRRMATPSWDDPTVLVSTQGNSGKPGCLPRVLPRPVVWLPDQGPLNTDALVHSWPWALRKYVFPPVSLLAQTCGCYHSTSRCSGRPVPGKARSHCEVPKGSQEVASS